MKRTTRDGSMSPRQTDTASFRKYGVNKGVLGACIYEALNLSARVAAGAS